MIRRLRHLLRRLRLGDVLIGLALAALLAALFAPTLRARRFQALVDEAITDVDALGRAALGVRSRSGDWPAPARAGVTPEGLTRAGPSALRMAGEAYTIRWTVWDEVDWRPAPAPPPTTRIFGDAPPDSVTPELVAVIERVGGVVVLSENDALLGELLAHFGDEVSFVRDSAWTVVARPGSDLWSDPSGVGRRP